MNLWWCCQVLLINGLINGLFGVEGLSVTSRLERWKLADTILGRSVEGQIAWRRLARETSISTRELQDSIQNSPPLLPYIEEWEYNENGFVVGVLDRKNVEIKPRINGDRVLSHSLLFAADGTPYELGPPSDTQIEKWQSSSLQTPQLPSLAMPIVSTVLALGTLSFTVALLTHHLQIQVFVI